MQRKPKRSSILKLPKQTVRAPLQDLDSIQGDEEDGNTTQPSSRRVSFSRTSQIKEFDPTIGYMTQWNQSYEESINIVENDENHPKSSNTLDEITKLHVSKLNNRRRRSSKFRLSLNSAGIEAVGNVCLASEQSTAHNINEKILKQSRAINHVKADDAAKSDMSMFCEDLDVSISRGGNYDCSSRTTDFFDSTIADRISEDSDEAHNLNWKRDMLASEPMLMSSSDVKRKTSSYLVESNNKKESYLCVDNTTRNLQSCLSIQNQTVLNMLDMDMTLGVDGIQDIEKYRAESLKIPNLNTSMDMTVPMGKIEFHESHKEQSKSLNQEKVVNECDIVGKDQIHEQQKIKVPEKKIGNPVHGTSLFLHRTIDNDVDMDITIAGGTIQIEGVSEAIDACQVDHLKELASESLEFTIPFGNLKLEDAESSDAKSDIQKNLNNLDTRNTSVNIKSNKEKNAALLIAKTDQHGTSQTSGSLSERNATKHKSFYDDRGDKTFLNAEGMELTVPMGILNVPVMDKSCQDIMPSESLGRVARQQDIIFTTDTDSKKNVAHKLITNEQLLKGKGTKRHADSEVEYIAVNSAVNCSIYGKNGCNSDNVSEEDDITPDMEFTVPLGKLKMAKLEDPLQTIVPGSFDIMRQKGTAFTTGINSMANLPPELECGKQHSMSKKNDTLENSDMKYTVVGGAIQVANSYYDNGDGIGLTSQILNQEDETVPAIVGMEFTVPVGKLCHQNLQNSIEKGASVNLDKSWQDSSVTLKADLKENVVVSTSNSDEQHLMSKDNITSVNSNIEYIVGSRAVLDNHSCHASEDVDQANQIAEEEEEIFSGSEGMEFTVPLGKLIHPQLEKNVKEVIDESMNSKIANQKDIAFIKGIDSKGNIPPVMEDNEKHFISNHNKSLDSVSDSKFQSLTDPVLPDGLKSENLNNSLQKITSESSNKTSIQQNVSISLPTDLEKSVPISTLVPNENHSLNNDPCTEHVDTGESTQVNHSQCDVSESVCQSSRIFQQDEETLPNAGGMELTVPLGKLIYQKLENPVHKAITEISDSVSTKKDGTFIIVADSARKSFTEHVDASESTQVNHSQCDVTESVCQSSHIFQQEEETLPNSGGMELTVPLGKLIYQKLENPVHKAITEISDSVSTKKDGTFIIVADSARKSFSTSIHNEQHLMRKDNETLLDEMEYTVAVGTVQVNCINYDNNENSGGHNFEHYKTIPDAEGMEFTVPHGKLEIQELDDSHRNIPLELLHANKKDITVTRGDDSVEHAPAFHQNNHHLIINKNIAEPDTECAVVCGAIQVNHSNCEGVEDAKQASQYEQQEDEVLQDNKGMEFAYPPEKLMQQELKSSVHKLLPGSLNSKVGRKIGITFDPEANSKEDIPMLVIHNNESFGNPELGTTVEGGAAQVNHRSDVVNNKRKCPEGDETVPDNVAMEFTVALGLLKLQNLPGPQEEISESSGMVVSMPRENAFTGETDLAEKVHSTLEQHLMNEGNEKLNNHEKNCNVPVEEVIFNQSLRDVEFEEQKLDDPLLKEIPKSFEMLEGHLANDKEDLMRNIPYIELNHNEQLCISKDRGIPIHPDIDCDLHLQDKPLSNDNNESLNQVKTGSQKENETFRVAEVIESSKFHTSNEPVLLNRSKSEKLENSVQEVPPEGLNKALSHKDGFITKNVDFQENNPVPNSHVIIPNGEELLDEDKKLVEPDTMDVKLIEINHNYCNANKSIIQANKDFQHKDEVCLVTEGSVSTVMKDSSIKDFLVDTTVRSENKYIFKEDQNSSTLSIAINKMNKNKRENPYDCTMPNCKRAASEEQLAAAADHRNEDENTPNLAIHSSGVGMHENEKEHDMDDLEDSETRCDTSNGIQMDAAVSYRILERCSSSFNEEDSVASNSKSLSEKSSSSFSPGDAVNPFIAEDWINEEACKKSCPWLIHKLTDKEWSFLLFYQSIKLTLVLEPLEENPMQKNNRVVENVQLTSGLVEGNRDSDYVVHRVLLERCPSSTLTQICRSTAQIPELFQFLNSEVEIINILLAQATKLDSDYPVAFKDNGFVFTVTSMKLLKVFHVKVNLMNWQDGCINPEDVKVINYIGKTRDSDIQAVVGLIKKDKNFLPSLYDAILDFMEEMEKLED